MTSRERLPAKILDDVRDLLRHFEAALDDPDLRGRVKGLIPVREAISDLGISLIDPQTQMSARDRILAYLCRYPQTVIDSDELAVVSGISEYARRIRELRVQFGWPIISGVTARELATDGSEGSGDAVLSAMAEMRPDQYMLAGAQDRDAAHRWALGNEIRRRGGSMRDRLIAYFRANVGRPVNGEELRYVARGQSWPRRVRELRTEEGWPIATRVTGRDELSPGAYMLEADRQSEPHDRKIADLVRIEVLDRDGRACRNCGWSVADRAAGDPRTHLELHHVRYHVEKGENSPENLITLCSVCHDEVHRKKLKTREGLEAWLWA